MNWIKKTLKIGEKIKKILKARPSKKDIENSEWTSCCKGPVLKKDLEENLWTCNLCGKHHRINSKQRFDIFFGKNNYEILRTPIPVDDPLDWKDSKTYKDRLIAARKKTGQETAVLIAKGNINKIDVTVGAIDFNFIGGSVGAAEGEAIIYGIQHAIDNSTPFIFFPCGGGQRMFESPIALSQMTRTTLAVNELKKNNLPYIICFTDPTAGGITASFAMLGDISLAEPGALIAFAGKRVIQATVKEDLPENFQTSEYLLKCGFVDLIVERKDLSKKIGILLSILLKKKSDINTESDETSKDFNTFTKAAS
tara:strand:+ start:1484 stop:2413 length:930 start_codon:yes stop_codon:yes gene_type:complete